MSRDYWWEDPYERLREGPPEPSLIDLFLLEAGTNIRDLYRELADRPACEYDDRIREALVRIYRGVALDRAIPAPTPGYQQAIERAIRAAETICGRLNAEREELRLKREQIRPMLEAELEAAHQLQISRIERERDVMKSRLRECAGERDAAEAKVE